jgi:hypothetical protein
MTLPKKKFQNQKVQETPAGAYMSRFSSHSGAKPIILPFKVAATSGSGISSSGGLGLDLRPDNDAPEEEIPEPEVAATLNGKMIGFAPL